MEKKPYYITTPIYYPSGNWHVGHCYTTVACDALARFHRMLGEDVFFLTGTDEHGQKIDDRAKAAGTDPQTFVDGLVASLKSIWARLDISYTKFIRTTDDYHVKAVQNIFRKLYDKGDIYKSEYEGWYCTPCESFWTESQLADGKCPDCGRPVAKQKEESYFFRLSKYQDRLLRLFEENPDFLEPKSRVNEMVNNFLKPGLQDLCVSRTSFKWGIPVPFDEKHVVYVWLDALFNYVTALGYGSSCDADFKKYWPADLHLMAKEIVRFHTIIWPAFLMALDLPLPRRVFGHGWLLIGGDKLSKSKMGNVKSEMVEPNQLIDRYGADAIRYFLLREIPFGNDGVYTNEALISRINSDLANDLGNLVSRTTAMIAQYFGGELPAPAGSEDPDEDLKATALGVFPRTYAAMEALNAPDALSEIFRLVQRANKYIDETMPWALAKDPARRARLGTVLYNLSECIRIASVMLKPVLTKRPETILANFGEEGSAIVDFEGAKTFGALRPGTTVRKSAPLFPRIDVKKELEEIDRIMNASKKEEPAMEEEKQGKQPIGIEDFEKISLKVALVTACEKVEKADKLLKLTVKLGDETRTVVSGIAKSYTPEEMVGKKIVMIANLKPVKLRGIVSEGMIVCAENAEGKLSLLSPERDIEDGSEIF